MGRSVGRVGSSSRTLQRFQQSLAEDLDALGRLLARPGFGEGPSTFGAELELYIVNAQGRPLGCNRELQRALADPGVTLELNRYNLEYNLTPVPTAGHPFSACERQILSALERLNGVAAGRQARVLPIGILPTLKRRDFGPRHMTDSRRYHCLTERLVALRGQQFRIRINGEEPLELRSRDLTLEGANTSLQLHYRVAPADYARTFNAIQLATPVALAIACNSPFMLGRRLWQETRIPLFKHAVDGCSRDLRDSHLPSRVDLGNGWVRQGAHELFAESVYLHPPLLPVCRRESPLQQVARGETPELSALRLHQGTVWPWNRAIYDPQEGGHLRIELRALPAGPSACDMMANAAFLLGVAEGLAPQMERLMAALPYQTLVYNFYHAAREGRRARLFWPGTRGGGLEELNAADLARRLLPTAAEGLARIGIHRQEREHYLGVIAQRLEAATSGADWQLRQFARLCRVEKRHLALSQMVRGYMANSEANRPVALWEAL